MPNQSRWENRPKGSRTADPRLPAGDGDQLCGSDGVDEQVAFEFSLSRGARQGDAPVSQGVCDVVSQYRRWRLFGKVASYSHWAT
jgi:hypothetical protein